MMRWNGTRKIALVVCAALAAAVLPGISGPAPGYLLSAALAMAILFLLSAFFSGSETALLSLSPAHVRIMEEEGLPGARAVRLLRRTPNRMLITILLGNNAANIGASVLATTWATGLFGPAALPFVTIVMTISVLIVGEIFPKALAQKHGDRISRWVARPILVLQTALLPLTYVLERLLEGSLPALGSSGAPKQKAMSELRAMLQIATEGGHIRTPLRDVLSSALSFASRHVADVLTPRDRVVAIDLGGSLDELRRLFVSSGRSRIPVFQGEPDRVVGVATQSALLRAQEEGKARIDELDLVETLFLEPSLALEDALLAFQAERQHLAVVRDAAGRLRGIVTIEDVMEEIVGELFDEEVRDTLFLRRTGPDSWEVRGDCPLAELRRDWPDFARGEPAYRSVENLYQVLAKKRPREGDRYSGEEFILRVMGVHEGSILSLRVERTSPPSPPPTDAPVPGT